MKSCPKCKGEMEKGFLVDEGVWGTAFKRRQRWALGANFFGLKKVRNINSFRCQKCGYLENFAPDKSS